MLNLAPATLIARVIVLLVAFTIHEFSHALTATEFGDDTPRMYGRLTLNPLAHLDPLGSLLLLVAGFGWAKPVPINPYILQRRARSAVMWVSLAGPFSNLLMAIVASIPLRLGWASVSLGLMPPKGFFPSPSLILVEFVFINLLLMLFNLIPLAPLDGEKILEFFLPPSWAKPFETIRPYGPMILIAMIALGSFTGFDLIGKIIMPPLQTLFMLLVG